MELVNIDFNNYIQNLIPYLFHTFGAENRISLKTTGDDIWLNIDTVIPCGLIVNELVSNSLKHAFPGDRKGEVYVGINSNGDGQYVLIVGDNGVGFPEDLDFRSTKSLGLQLVLMLVEQIEGKIELDRTNGTEFKIRFRESGKKQNFD
jgi:two-component sensor histidine kinase